MSAMISLTRAFSHWSGPVELGFFDWLTLYLRFLMAPMGVLHVSYELLAFSHLVITSCTKLLLVNFISEVSHTAHGVHNVNYGFDQGLFSFDHYKLH
jgi:hypothetical protein